MSMGAEAASMNCDSLTYTVRDTNRLHVVRPCCFGIHGFSQIGIVPRSERPGPTSAGVISLELAKLLARYLGNRKALILAVVWLIAAPSLRASCSGPPQLEALLRTHPSANAYADLGTWFSNRRQFACAAKAFEKGLEMNPGSAHLAYRLGASLYSAGNVKEAIGSLQQSVRLDPKVVQPHLILGAALDDVHDTTNAEIEWRAALTLDPKSTTARAALSKDLLTEKDYGSEIALLRAASASGQLTPELTLDLALAYGQIGMLQDAN